jgi:hypothetical protein
VNNVEIQDLNLPQFDGHFGKGYTNLKGVSHEKEEGI